MKTPLVALALAAALSLPAMAQTAAPAQPQTDQRQQMRERFCRDLDAHLAARLAFAEAKVKPTEQQRAAWEIFARESRAASSPMQAVMCAAQATAPAANDLAARLVERERRAAAMLDSVRQLRVAVEKLQPLLSDEQKTALAENMGRRGMDGRRGHWHGPRGR